MTRRLRRLIAFALAALPAIALPAILAAAIVLPLPACAEPEKQSDSQPNETSKCIKCKIAGLHVAVWKPSAEGKAPLVIFSHGSGGKNTKSRFIMEALARSGYLVMAPNHKDSTLTGVSLRPDWTFKKASKWDDKMYEARRNDIVKLLAGLHADSDWDSRIDWSNLGLCGHSLGGYAVLGMCGAWPSWKIDGVKAVLTFSPYCQPFVLNGKLGEMAVPVMYQGGTKDRITQSVVCKGGAFDQTASPVYLVEFDRAGHLAWTNFKHNKQQRQLINYYSRAFLDKYLSIGKADSIAVHNSGQQTVPDTERTPEPDARLDTKLDGVYELEKK